MVQNVSFIPDMLDVNVGSSVITHDHLLVDIGKREAMHVGLGSIWEISLLSS